MLKSKFIYFFLFCVSISYSQNKITGTVYNEYLEPVYKAKVRTNMGMFKTDTEGLVSLKLKGDFPQKITVTFDGCDPEKIVITKNQELFTVVLKAAKSINKIVISASRTPERILESPSDIFRLGPNRIKSSVGSAYESLSYLPGVQLINNYNNFKSINTRGFSQFDNSRFVQQIDGIDSAIPASFLNQGDLGLPIDLDLQSIEILPGSASALYGANAYNGLMLVTTRNPFEHTGIDFRFKTGVIQQGEKVSNTYKFSIRNAYKFSESFAAKINFGYDIGEQWAATDYRNIELISSELNNKRLHQIPNYNGINTYGDEEITTYPMHGPYAYYDPNDPSTDIYKKYKDLYLDISRTGFTEQQLLNDTFKNKSIRFNSSLNFRPFSDKSLELILANNLSLSDKIVQGNQSRYVMNNFYLLKSKLEFKGDNFFLRVAYSGNKTDKVYDLQKLAINLNEKLMKLEDFTDNYYYMFDTAFNYNSTNVDLKKIRLDAENISGSIPRSSYQKYLNKIKNTSVLEDFGSAIYDNSNYVNIEGNYNASKLLNDFVNFQIGGSYKSSNTDSKGTLFNDLESSILIKEYGAYAQVQKKIFDDRLKFTGSLRYDKNQKFDGNISPRAAFNYVLGENRNHVLRASYQTGFRNPSMQELYAVNKIGQRNHIIGTAYDNNVSLINPRPYQGFIDEANYWLPSTPEYLKYKDSDYAIQNTTLDNILGNALIGFPFNIGNNKNRDFKLNKEYGKIKPEEVKTFELGYRSLFKLSYSTNLDLRVSGYYSIHQDFISLLPLTVPLYGKYFPKGDGYYTDAEIEKIQEEYGDTFERDYGDEYSLNTHRREDGKRQYIGTDMTWMGAKWKGSYKELEIYTNMKSLVTSYGFNIAGKTRLFNMLDLDLNYSFMDYKLEDKDDGIFKPNFNTPKHSAKLQIGSEKIIGNLGFNLGAKWSDSYNWQSNFASADIPSRTLLDARLSYQITKLNSTVNLGGTNLGGKDYQIAPGTGTIGQSLYVSWVIQN